MTKNNESERWIVIGEKNLPPPRGKRGQWRTVRQWAEAPTFPSYAAADEFRLHKMLEHPDLDYFVYRVSP